MITNKCTLSIIIISKNEEKNISKSIESAIEATKDIPNSEIILVDSASTDRTLEIALRYPIKIFQLSNDVPLSPGAGYYVGFLHSNGDYIHFHCGDMVLDKNWFKYALQIFDADNRIGGVFGMTTQEAYDTQMAKDYTEYSKNLAMGEATHYSGEALFKREPLQKVGTFNPFLRAGEEGELSYRIIEGGYKLLRLPYHMSHHLGFDKETFLASTKKKLRYTVAQGQIFRYSLENKNIFMCRLIEYKFKIIGFFSMILGIFSILSAIFLNNYLLIYLWILANVILFGWIIYETKNASVSVKLLFTQTAKSPFFIKGFFEPKKNPDIYLKFSTSKNHKA